MRILLKGLLTALAILALTTKSAGAQDGCFGPPIQGLEHQYIAGDMHLKIELIRDLGFYSTNCWSDVIGVYVFRRTIGNPCGPEVWITPELIEWVDDPGYQGAYVSADIVDTAVEPNRAYQYFARAVSLVPNDDCILGYVSTGPSLICRGTLHESPDCGISMVASVAACLIDCFAWSLCSYPAEAAPFVNTGTTLDIYGEFNGVFAGFCNTSVPVLNITGVEEEPCVNRVETMTWGAVKAKYR